MDKLTYQTLDSIRPDTLYIHIGRGSGTGVKSYEKIVITNGHKEITITMEKLFKVFEELFNE